MKRLLILLAIFILLSAVLPSSIDARVRRSRRASSTGTNVGVQTRVSLVRRGNGRAILIRFSGLNRVSSVNYTLSYTASGISQGVSGSLNLTGADTDSRELLLGTCSASVCVYHRNITDLKLTIVSTPKSGALKQITRSYRKKRI
jgi:hypothetical protein